MTNYATNSQTDKELLEKIDKELAAGHAVLETVATTAPPATTTTDTKPAKPKRTYLKVSDRMRIIDQFKHGIADPYYSVNPNPKKPGEYIVRKRKTPITYDLNTNTNNNLSPLSFILRTFDWRKGDMFFWLKINREFENCIWEFLNK